MKPPGSARVANEFVTRMCTCPRDSEGAIERGCIIRRDAYGHIIARDWYLLVNPACPVHGTGRR